MVYNTISELETLQSELSELHKSVQQTADKATSETNDFIKKVYDLNISSSDGTR